MLHIRVQFKIEYLSGAKYTYNRVNIALVANTFRQRIIVYILSFFNLCVNDNNEIQWDVSFLPTPSLAISERNALATNAMLHR